MRTSTVEQTANAELTCGCNTKCIERYFPPFKPLNSIPSIGCVLPPVGSTTTGANSPDSSRLTAVIGSTSGLAREVYRPPGRIRMHGRSMRRCVQLGFVG